ncbi:phage major capsid protein [Singulisphaera sp. PoT]|uniref:phage major capsid protein n=1 Tax=Singulisphaera sp. PoT TaxID=3411797 RepID=UPI003BF4C761
MWIQLTKDVAEHKAGKYLDVEESVARSYIAADLAVDGKDGPDTAIVQRAVETFRAELAKFVTGTADAMQEVTRSLADRRPNIITPGEQEADRTKGIGDFTRQVILSRSGDMDTMQSASERLTKVYEVKRVMTEGSGGSFGYTTPVVYENQILQVAGEDMVYLRGATEVPLSARETEWAALDQYQAPVAGQSAMYGGVKVYRKGETAQRTSSEPKSKKVRLVPTDLTAYFELSRDLIQDSTAALDSMIPKLGGDAIGWRIDWEGLFGNGAGQFLGMLNSPATLMVTRNTSGRVKYQDVFSMRVKAMPSAKNLRWIAHPYVFSDIMQLQDPSGRFIFLPNWPASKDGPIAQAPGGSLLGIPLEFSEKAPAPGSTGDLMLIDSSKYLHGKRSGLEISLSEHFRFDQDELAIRLKIRNDGQPWQRGPIYLADGSQSNQVSAFIALQ